MIQKFNTTTRLGAKSRYISSNQSNEEKQKYKNNMEEP